MGRSDGGRTGVCLVDAPPTPMPILRPETVKLSGVATLAQPRVSGILVVGPVTDASQFGLRNGQGWSWEGHRLNPRRGRAGYRWPCDCNRCWPCCRVARAETSTARSPHWMGIGARQINTEKCTTPAASNAIDCRAIGTLTSRMDRGYCHLNRQSSACLPMMPRARNLLWQSILTGLIAWKGIGYTITAYVYCIDYQSPVWKESYP